MSSTLKLRLGDCVVPLFSVLEDCFHWLYLENFLLVNLKLIIVLRYMLIVIILNIIGKLCNCFSSICMHDYSVYIQVEKTLEMKKME